MNLPVVFPLCPVMQGIISAPNSRRFVWILFPSRVLFPATFVQVVPLMYLNLNFSFWCGSAVTRIPEATIWKTAARLAASEVEITTVGTPKWACCYDTCSSFYEHIMELTDAMINLYKDIVCSIIFMYSL